MNCFLHNAKKHVLNWKTFDVIEVILGNEACDLDSAVSTLSYGYLLYKLIETTNTNTLILPVINLSSSNFHVKTEVNYFFKKHNISIDDLIFRNELNLYEINCLKKLKLHLVDHHILANEDSSLASSVATIIDHHPRDSNRTWNDINMKHDLVGSCASLIAEEIVLKKPDMLDYQIGILLYGTIILDTISFSEKAKRTTELDIKMAEELEKRCKINVNRSELLEELVKVRGDISTLTSEQLLNRDLKILNNVLLPGMPILIRDFVKRSDIQEALRRFCESHSLDLVVLLGMFIENDNVYRDLAVYLPNQNDKALKLCEALISCTDPCLNLVLRPCNIDGLKLFSQENITMTRKHILPLVKKILE